MLKCLHFNFLVYKILKFVKRKLQENMRNNEMGIIPEAKLHTITNTY